MKIYNTLTRTKEDFIPIDKNKVKMYVCGPTVYNYIHLGNGRPTVVFDTFRRFLKAEGYEVTYVTNFTDIDDRIIRAANDENVDSKVISERYIGEVLKDSDRLNCLRADLYPKVTEEIQDIVKMIEILVDKGFAYETEGTVFFHTNMKKDYGKLSKKILDDLESGARVETDERKRSVSDFVLWKPTKPGEPYWESPWGKGRPGWHIECSCMIRKYLGETIDIHAGGTDLVFPHHENEMAQSEAANGAPMANYWMHNGMINIDGEKMSKSEGNFFTIRDLGEKFGYDVVRFYMLTIHYRSPVNFTEENIKAAQNGLERIRNCVDSLKEIIKNDDFIELNIEQQKKIDDAEIYKKHFFDNMNDDFNTANAISDVFELVKYINITIVKYPQKVVAVKLLEKINELCDILGIKIEREESLSVAEGEIMNLIEERKKAREEKNWIKSDEIRDRLNNMGIAIKDTPNGTQWSYHGR